MRRFSWAKRMSWAPPAQCAWHGWPRFAWAHTFAASCQVPRTWAYPGNTRTRHSPACDPREPRNARDDLPPSREEPRRRTKTKRDCVNWSACRRGFRLHSNFVGDDRILHPFTRKSSKLGKQLKCPICHAEAMSDRDGKGVCKHPNTSFNIAAAGVVAADEAHIFSPPCSRCSRRVMDLQTRSPPIR